MALNDNCPHTEATFNIFRRCLSQFTFDEITATAGPDIANLLKRSAEGQRPRAVQITVLNGRGVFTSPLRGVHMLRAPMFFPESLQIHRSTSSMTTAILPP